MDNKTIYSIIITTVIIIIAVILYFLFVKKHITIASTAVTVVNNCPSPVTVVIHYPSNVVEYTLLTNQSISINYVQGMYIEFKSISGLLLGAVTPSPGQTITPSPCPSGSPLPITSPTISLTTAQNLVAIYNTCNYPVYAMFFPSGNTASAYYILNSQQTIPINYTSGMHLDFYMMSGFQASQYLGEIYPPPGTIITPPGCPSATSPPSTQTQTITVSNNCSKPVTVFIAYPPYPLVIGPFTINADNQPSVIAGYSPMMYVIFTTPSGGQLGTVYPSPNQNVTPQQCPS